MIPEGNRNLETLLGELMTEKQAAAALHRELETERAALEQEKGRLEGELKELQSMEKRVIAETRDTVVREAAELQREIRQAVADLRKEKSRDKLEQGRKALAIVHERLKAPTWQVKTEGGAAGTSLAVGDTVWLKEARVPATVLAVSGTNDQVEVQAGQVKMRLSAIVSRRSQQRPRSRRPQDRATPGW